MLFLFVARVRKIDLQHQIDASLVQAVEQLKQEYYFIPKTAHSRFRVETSGEQSEPWKDVGLLFETVEKATAYIEDFIPRNVHTRICFETMQVVKYREYKAPYVM